MNVYHSISARLITGLFCLALMSGAVTTSFAAKKQVLVISVTKGFTHSSIPLGGEIVSKLGNDSKLWETDFAKTDEELQAKTTPEALKKYSVIVFNNTTGELPLADKQAFLNWVKNGGGVVGIHAATDTFHKWPEFIDMIGGEFKTHGPQSEVEFIIEDPNHPATVGLPNGFKHQEEIYLLNNFSRSNVRVLITLDKHPTTRKPGDYPVAWVRDYGKGRVFYTSIGHREDLMQTDYYTKHLLGGFKWALGLAKGDATPVILSKADRDQGFRSIFNGIDTKGWHSRDDKRAAWTVQNGILTMGNGGADLITDEKFGDFIIRYEYRVPKNGNSGLYLRGRYEIQVLDDGGNQNPGVNSNGSIYGYIKPNRQVSKAAGEWQTVQAMLIGNRVTVFLNDHAIIVDQEIKGATGGALDGNVDQPGPIMLQGDHGPIEYRNIRIKPL